MINDIESIEDIRYYLNTDYQQPQPTINSTTFNQFSKTCEDLRKDVHHENLDEIWNNMKKDYYDTSNRNILNAIKQREHYLNKLSVVKDESIDVHEMTGFLKSLKAQVTEHKLKYGDDVLQVSENLLNSYDENYKIISFHNYGLYHRVLIQFLVDGKLISDFPVQLDVDMNITKILNIETKIYPSNKLLDWLEKHNNQITELLNRLHKTLVFHINNTAYHYNHTNAL